MLARCGLQAAGAVSLKRSAQAASLARSLPSAAPAALHRCLGTRGWLDNTVAAAASSTPSHAAPRPSALASAQAARASPEGYEDSLAAPQNNPHEMVSSILQGVEHDKAQRDSRVVLAVLVDNEAGVLNKVCGLLSARGFNIESLTVSPTNLDTLSRMTVVIRDASEEKANQAIKQLQDVVNVWAVVNYTGTNSLHVRLRAPVRAAAPPPPSSHTRAPNTLPPAARAGHGQGQLHAQHWGRCR